MRISQNSSAFGGVRCVIARAFKIENGRSRRKAFDERRCPLTAISENPYCVERSGRDDARVVTKRRSSLTTIAFASGTASTLLTKRNSLPMPRFRQTCGRKCRTPCGGQSAKRDLLNNSQ
jgi:hypothetical protein